MKPVSKINSSLFLFLVVVFFLVLPVIIVQASNSSTTEIALSSTTVASTTTVPTTAGTTITAGGSFRELFYDSVRYEFHDYKLGWNSAQEICLGRNMNLATSYSASVDAWIESQMSSSSSYAHIGGFYPTSTSSAGSSTNRSLWKWKSTGDYIWKLGFSNWYSSSYPTSNSGSACMHVYKLSTASGFWWNGHCTSYKYPFICSSYPSTNNASSPSTSTTVSETTTTATTISTPAASGTVRYFSYFDSSLYVNYEFHDYRLSWTAAEAVCNSRGLSLVTIYSSAVQNFIQGKMSYASSAGYHIGLFAQYQTSNRNLWKWIGTNATTSSLGFENWFSSTYPSATSGTCAHIWAGTSLFGWWNSQCSSKYHFCCSNYASASAGGSTATSTTTSTASPAPTPTAAGTVSYGSYYSGSQNVRFEFHLYNKNFQDGRAVCLSRGLDLASIPDAGTWTYIKSQISSGSTYYVGGHVSSPTNVRTNWRWIGTNSYMTYFGFWSQDQPNGDGTCLRISGLKGWDGGCSSTYKFICSSANTASAPSPTSFSPTSSSFRSATFDGLTYEFWDSSYMTHSAAQTHCASRGKGLAAIYSAAVNNFVHNNIFYYYSSYIVGGFSSTPAVSSSWTWTSIARSISSMHYSNWRPNQPSSSYANMMIMAAFSGQWSTTYSTSTYPFVCQTIPSSTKMNQAAQQNEAAANRENSDSALSGGAVAGIVIGVIAAIVIIILLIFYGDRLCRGANDSADSGTAANAPASDRYNVNFQQSGADFEMEEQNDPASVGPQPLPQPQPQQQQQAGGGQILQGQVVPGVPIYSYYPHHHHHHHHHHHDHQHHHHHHHHHHQYYYHPQYYQHSPYSTNAPTGAGVGGANTTTTSNPSASSSASPAGGMLPPSAFAPPMSNPGMQAAWSPALAPASPASVSGASDTASASSASLAPPPPAPPASPLAPPPPPPPASPLDSSATAATATSAASAAAGSSSSEPEGVQEEEEGETKEKLEEGEKEEKKEKVKEDEGEEEKEKDDDEGEKRRKEIKDKL